MLSPRTLQRFKKEILGANYALSFCIIPPKRMRELNKTYRSIDAPTDILSFPLSKTVGEIYICKSEVAKHAKEFSMPVHKYLPYLIIHGMIHLRGYDHGVRMTAREKYYSRILKVDLPSQYLNVRSSRSRN